MTAEAELLKGVTEVARLLQADGAMIYLVDETKETLRLPTTRASPTVAPGA